MSMDFRRNYELRASTPLSTKFFYLLYGRNTIIFLRFQEFRFLVGPFGTVLTYEQHGILHFSRRNFSACREFMKDPCFLLEF